MRQETPTSPIPATKTLRRAALACLLAESPESKCALTLESALAWKSGVLGLAEEVLEVPLLPGRPPRPPLVHPRELAQRSLKTLEGRAALIHAVTHIEFSAINLAWDAVARFAGMPRDYYDDWVRVAAEEAAHFRMLQARLQDLGHDYGDFPAHNGLWYMAQRTADDLLARMAMVPRVLEARGLDVTPGMIARLRQAGDRETAELLEIIWREEIGHVQAGSRWFHHLCALAGQDPEGTYFELLGQYLDHGIRCPLHRGARAEAGFSEPELDRLEALCGGYP